MTNSKTPIPVLLVIDVEPDGLFIDRTSPVPWQGFERAVQFFRAFRAQAEKHSQRPARFTWALRMDPQIGQSYGRAAWVAEHYASLISELGSAGDELGLHTHAYRWDEKDAAWIIDHGNQTWVEHCLETSFNAFETTLGRKCRTFRFGDRWLNNETVQWLKAHDVQFELTLEPGHPSLPSYHPEEPFTGTLPDYAGVPRDFYRPTITDYRIADGSLRDGIWMVPMSTASVRAQWLRRAYYRLFRPDVAVGHWTALMGHEPGLFKRIVTYIVEQTNDRHLALPIRSNAFICRTTFGRLQTNLAWLLEHPPSAGMVWTTPAEAVRNLHPEGLV